MTERKKEHLIKLPEYVYAHAHTGETDLFGHRVQARNEHKICLFQKSLQALSA